LAERDVQLHLAAKIGRIGTFTIDYTTGVIQLSPGCTNVYGLSEGTTTLSLEKGWTFVHPDDLPSLADLRSQVFQKQKSEFVAQFRIVRADNNEVRWLETRSLIAYGKDGQPLRLVGASIDVTELRANEDHKSMLIAELDHRVKNTLACVSAIAMQTREDCLSMDDFLEAFNGRIHSLATTHALLSRSRWHAVGLAELIRNELAPCMKKDNTTVEGPDIYLSVEAAQTIAMVFHELATNAAKYGALSNGNGRVSVCWEKLATGSSFDGLKFEWQETGGPTVLPPGAYGYGTNVIRNLIPYELGGTVDYVFAPAGVRCTLQVPDKWLASRAS
jgi:two-component sensor histidine kinase